MEDWRNVQFGSVIDQNGYADQPYVVVADDGAWVCTVTVGPGTEGQAGQHLVSFRSYDRGRTWTDRRELEPAGGPEASYSVLLKTPYGRIYCFYNYNIDNLRSVQCDDGGTLNLIHLVGAYVFRYSDDHGRSWSDQRYVVPVRAFACDRQNIYQGRVRFCWGVGRPLVLGERVLIPHYKIHGFRNGDSSAVEGAFVASDNLLYERDPQKIRFDTLPDGDVGLRTPPGGGPIAEELSIVALSDSSVYCVFRTRDGYPAWSISRDAGHTWSVPQYLTYTPNGRRIRQRRAATFVWKCSNGKYLLWFHNNGGPAAADPSWHQYCHRNPAWLAAGREIDTPTGKAIEWSQPEILLYDTDPDARISYPDLLEIDGEYYVTETQKQIARIHAIDRSLLDGLFNQWDARAIATTGLLAAWASESGLNGKLTLADGEAIALAPDRGFTIDLWLTAGSLAPGQVLVEARDGEGHFVRLETADRNTIALAIGGAENHFRWEADPGILKAGHRHHLVCIVDGGPRIASLLVDGQLCDGGDERDRGWVRYPANLPMVRDAGALDVGTSFDGMVHRLRVYGRPLRTSEAVAHYRAGAQGNSSSKGPAC
mgnify:CR=1 FL=1